MYMRWLIIDGYSLVFRDESLARIRNRNMPLARQLLVRKIQEVAGALAERTTMVFDGQQGGLAEGFEASGVEVLFSPAHHTADTVIERLVFADTHPETILVVTSDRPERENTSAAGAQTMSCGDFLSECERLFLQIKRRASASPPDRKFSSSLGERFPPG